MGHRHHALPPHVLLSLLLGAALSPDTPAATDIEIGPAVVQDGVKRLGINLGTPNYWDSGQMTKLLAFRNPGFEGEIYRSIMRCESGTATSCTDDNEYTAWPTGYWNGATYHIVFGAARGRTGSIVQSIEPSNGSGTTYVFDAAGTVPALGDQIVLTKVADGRAEAGWWPGNCCGGTVATEMSDLPPGTAGRQAIRLDSVAGDYPWLSAYTDSLAGESFLRMEGTFRVRFSAKSLSGSGRLRVIVRRDPALFLDRWVTLTNAWATYTLDFAASEPVAALGVIELRFAPEAPASQLLDEVELFETGTDPANTSLMKDEVVDALRDYRPGVLRYMEYSKLGDSLDNQLAPLLARRRSGYSAFYTEANDVPWGLHEFLELCELVGAEPWYTFSVTYDDQEVANLMEYLGGPASSPNGARRSARGRPAPWTDAFDRIHLEFGNEAWNGNYMGAAIGYPDEYGGRASQVFAVAKASPYYDAATFDMVLGGQAGWPGRNLAIHAASSTHDSMSLAPYMAGLVDSFGSDEELYGPLFAEPEWWSKTGFMRQTFDGIQASALPVPLSIYEVNLHTTQGAISQQALDGFTPSEGAGIAVAAHQLMMMKELGVKDQLSFCLPGFAFDRDDGKSVRLWGIVRDMGKTDLRRPQFLALALANGAIGGSAGTTVAMRETVHGGDDPTWDQPLVNRIEYAGAHYLQSYAFDAQGAKSVVVFNLHRTSALDVTFSGADAPRGTVRIDELGAASIHDHNEDADVVRTTTRTVPDFDPAAPMSLPPHSMTVIHWPLAEGNLVAGLGHGLPNENRVRVLRGDGSAGADFLAYGAGRFGVNVAAASLDAAALDEIATGPGPGDVFGPQIRGFARDGTAMGKVNFYAYGTLRFGANVAAGDVDGDGFSELLSGAGPGAVFGPHVRGFDVDGGAATPIAKLSFFAYGTLRWGVEVAAGDLEGDQLAEIATGPGPGAIFSPQVRGFDLVGGAPSALAKVNFQAFALDGYGARVAAGDVEDDGFAEIVAAPGPWTAAGHEPRFAGFDYDGAAVTSLPGYAVTLSPTLRYGGRPGLGELSGDGALDLAAGPGPDPAAAAVVATYRYDGAALVALAPVDAFPGRSYGLVAGGGDFGY